MASLRELVRRRLNRTPDTTGARNADNDYIWAIKGIDLEVLQGEILGILGRNGAGKSTLLKILSRITPPSEGFAKTTGRVGSLLEVGTGFHPELTGRENVYLNGAILGMPRKELNKKFDEIVSFAGTEQFLDTPVKKYSSGMFVRLAFAVAAHLDPDILIIDEVLSVGDANFQRKCLDKIRDIASSGRTVLFVSHNTETILSLCTRCVWIDQSIRAQGSPLDVVTEYLTPNMAEQTRDGQILPDMHIEPNGDLFFTRVSVLNPVGEPVQGIAVPQTIRFSLCFDVVRSVQRMQLILEISKADRSQITVLHNTDNEDQAALTLSPGQYETFVEVALPLMPGTYFVSVAAKPEPGYYGSGPTTDWVRDALEFSVSDISSQGRHVRHKAGVVIPIAHWELFSRPRDTSSSSPQNG